MLTEIDISDGKIVNFCRQNYIQRLAFFGSVLRDDFNRDSDVDVLVEFEPGHVPGLAFITMQDELSAILGRRVDMNTPSCLSSYFREEVLKEAQTAYDAT
jgi:uncharacterized protein